jgi:hypothetical protein
MPACHQLAHGLVTPGRVDVEEAPELVVGAEVVPGVGLAPRWMVSLPPGVGPHLVDARVAVVKENEGGPFELGEFTRDPLGLSSALVFRKRLRLVLVADDPAALDIRFNVDDRCGHWCLRDVENRQSL